MEKKMRIMLPEVFKIVEAMPNATDAAGRTGDWVSLKNALMAWVVLYVTQAHAATIAITINQASAVAGTGSKPVTVNGPIWSNLDTAASDTLVRRADAVAQTTDAGIKNKMVVFQIDPATLDVAGGFDCIAVITGASNAANITGAMYFVQSAYQQTTPPAAITD